MKLRKVVSLFLAMLLILSCAAFTVIAEGDTVDLTSDLVGDGSGVTLKMLLPWETIPKATLYEILDEYFKETGVSTEVIITNSSGGWAGYFQKIQTIIAANDNPDLIYIAIEGFRIFQENDLIIPINEYIDASPEAQQVLEDIHPNTIAPYIVDDNYYAFTFEWNNVLTHINTNVLEKAGLEMPEGEWTKDDYLDYARAMTYINDDGQQVYGAALDLGYFITSPLLFNNNASFLNEDWTASEFNSDEAKEVIQFLYDLVYVEKVAPAPGGDIGNMFMNDLVGMYMAGRWPIKGYVESGFDAYDVALVPAFQRSQVVLGGGLHPIMKTSEYKQEAFDLSVYLAKAETQMKALDISGIPSSIKAMDAMVETGVPKHVTLFRDSADIAYPVESPPAYAEICQIYDRYMSLIFADEMPVSDALDAAAAEMTAALWAY